MKHTTLTRRAFYAFGISGFAIVLIATLFLITSSSFAFTGPTCATGNCSGAISADNANNVGINTSSPASQTRLTVVASTTGSAGYFPLKVLKSDLSPIFIVQDDGKIGVGDAAPSQQLSVAGNIYLTGSITGGSISAANVSSAQFGSAGAGGNFFFPANLGVGQASASYRIDVAGGDINTSGVYRKGGTAGVSPTACAGGQVLTNMTVSGGIVTGAGSCVAVGGGGGSGTITTSSVPTTNYIPKFTGVSTIANSQIFDNAANVGINTAAPGYKLDVQGGDVNTSGVYRKGGTAGLTATCTSGQVLATTTVSGGIVTGGTCVSLGGGGTVTSVAAGTGISASPSPIVGAGTISLNINGGTTQTCGAGNHVSSITATGTVTCTADTAGTNYWTLSGLNLYPNLTTYNLGAGTAAPDANYKLTTSGGGVKADSTNQPAGYFNSASGYGLLVNAGNVGIGNLTPTYKLDVTGAARFTGDVILGDNAGTDLTVGGGTGKINAGTIDPIYTIAGKRYATYVSGIVGQKEELTGTTRLVCNANGICIGTLDFAKPQGSDEWLFGKVTDLKNNMNALSVLLTPAFDGKIWYEKDQNGMRLIVRGMVTSGAGHITSAEISYRLTAPRFDAAKWPTVLPLDSSEPIGFVIE